MKVIKEKDKKDRMGGREMCAIKLALLYMSKMTVEKIINMET
jgi:hypothetical protein